MFPWERCGECLSISVKPVTMAPTRSEKHGLKQNIQESPEPPPCSPLLPQLRSGPFASQFPRWTWPLKDKRLAVGICAVLGVMCPEAPGSLLSTRCRYEIPGEEGAQPGNESSGACSGLGGGGRCRQFTRGSQERTVFTPATGVRHSPGILFGEGPTRPQSSAEGYPSSKSLQPRPALHHPVDRSPPGSSAHGIPQARTRACAAGPSSSDLPRPGLGPASVTPPASAGQPFSTSATREAPSQPSVYSSLWIQTEPGFRFQLSHVPARCDPRRPPRGRRPRL